MKKYTYVATDKNITIFMEGTYYNISFENIFFEELKTALLKNKDIEDINYLLNKEVIEKARSLLLNSDEWVVPGD